MKYPTGFESDNTWGQGVIFQGHGWSEEYCLQMMSEWDRAMIPEEDEVMIVQEWLFKYRPRVMWCQNYDGFPCDNVGTWHPHWSEMVIDPTDSPENKFTVVYVVEKS